MAPTKIVAIRAAFTCSCGVTCSLRITPTYRSWAIALAAASTNPATTATIVANATAETKAMKRLPPSESGPPPRACASSGLAILPPGSMPAIAGAPTFIAAPMPRNSVQHVEAADDGPSPSSPTYAAACAVGTVKNRIRMCGMPAVPNTSAMPREIWFKQAPSGTVRARGRSGRVASQIGWWPCRRSGRRRGPGPSRRRRHS